MKDIVISSSDIDDDGSFLVPTNYSRAFLDHDVSILENYTVLNLAPIFICQRSNCIVCNEFEYNLAGVLVYIEYDTYYMFRNEVAKAIIQCLLNTPSHLIGPPTVKQCSVLR